MRGTLVLGAREGGVGGGRRGEWEEGGGRRGEWEEGGGRRGEEEGEGGGGGGRRRVSWRELLV